MTSQLKNAVSRLATAGQPSRSEISSITRMALFPRKPSDKRKHYRVDVDKELGVSMLKGEEWRSVPLLDVTSGGAALLLNPMVAKRFKEGQQISLRFTLRGRGLAIDCTSVMRNSEPVESQFGEGIRIGVQFDETEKLYEQLDPGYWVYFNRRKGYRVEIKRDRPAARVTWPGKRLEGEIQDLGISGCGVSFARDTPLLLFPGATARVEFIIPDTSKSETISCTVVYREARRTSLTVGFEFDPGSTPNFPKLQEVIRDHVMRRQREFLQGGR